MTRPRSSDEFKLWSSPSTCGALAHPRLEQWYKTTQNNVVTQLQDDDLLSRLPGLLDGAAEAFAGGRNGARLFGVGRDAKKALEWQRKPVASFIEKLYRLNVVENSEFPSPPADGWITPVSSLRFGGIDDIVRSTVVVAYADAAPFLAEFLISEAGRCGYKCTSKDHTKEKGYYAHHWYLATEVDIAHDDGTFSKIAVPVEVQITTELQAALREVTYRLYQDERLAGDVPDDWKTNFGSGRFRAAYMAHSLRFIEAMIVDLRNITMGADHK